MKIYSHKNNTDNIQEFYFKNQQLDGMDTWIHVSIDLNKKELVLKKILEFNPGFDFKEVSNFPFPSGFLTIFINSSNKPAKEFEVFEEIDPVNAIKFFRFTDKEDTTNVLEIKLDNIQNEFSAKYCEINESNPKWRLNSLNITPISLFKDFLSGST